MRRSVSRQTKPTARISLLAYVSVKELRPFREAIGGGTDIGPPPVSGVSRENRQALQALSRHGFRKQEMLESRGI
jgi:hypothetical protein